MSTSHTDRHDELLPAYALGALEGDELRELEAHLATGCPECRRELLALQGGLEALAVSIPRVEPSPRTREQILRRIGDSPDRRRKPLPRWLGRHLRGG